MDMDWLRTAHLPRLDVKYLNGCAILFGNEDCPRKIWVFESREPLYTEDPLVFVLDKETLEYTGTKWD